MVRNAAVADVVDVVRVNGWSGPLPLGVGALSPGMARRTSDSADAGGLPCYLEASGEKNRSLYEHLGYRVVGQCVLSEPTSDPGRM